LPVANEGLGSTPTRTRTHEVHRVTEAHRRKPATPRLAHSSYFGNTGTTAHNSFEQAPPIADDQDTAPSADSPSAALPHLLSGKTRQALAAQARRLDEFVGANPNEARFNLVEGSHELYGINVFEGHMQVRSLRRLGFATLGDDDRTVAITIDEAVDWAERELASTPASGSAPSQES